MYFLYTIVKYTWESKTRFVFKHTNLIIEALHEKNLQKSWYKNRSKDISSQHTQKVMFVRCRLKRALLVELSESL